MKFIKLLIVGLVQGITIWPEPASFKTKNEKIKVGRLRFAYSGRSTIVKEAFLRYSDQIFSHGITGVPRVQVYVEIEDENSELGSKMNESYIVNMKTNEIFISSKTQWGILRALESLSQLFEYDAGDETYYLTLSEIQDEPRFSHRGLLIDSGRHFLNVKTIKAMIDSMAYVKLNVLHWHLTEDQSFSMPSWQFPELSLNGSFSAKERYSHYDIKDIVQYAKLRGIRVIPEFDMPGHTSSWRNSHPEIFATGCLDPDSRGAFDPAKNQTFELISALFHHDWFYLFPDAWLHLGSDEVPTTCWNNSIDLAFMELHNLSSFNNLFAYFVNSVVDIALQDNKKQHIILWDEAFTSGSPDPNKTIIQIWHDDVTNSVLDAGFQVIYSPSSAWYLDHLDTNWTDRYTLNIPDSVLGGEACAWGETMDPSDIEATVWPSLAAVAERLWSPLHLTLNLTTAESRLRQFRCILLDRGVRAEPVGLAGRTAPTGPGSCLYSD
uniref:Beta-hexosaminidase n=1 Tax=Aureoumbra lagunensis TaxID=44058 RepID=A0A7S3JN57_9STRA